VRELGVEQDFADESAPRSDEPPPTSAAGERLQRHLARGEKARDDQPAAAQT
jgi:hypothetical protein